jgi:protoporphyrinogen oxidase
MTAGNGAGRPTVAVIGGGFTGLAAALDLATAGAKPVVLEAAPEVAGLAASFQVGGERLDAFYHHWFRSDHDIIELIEELGLAANLVWHASSTGLRYRGRTYRLSSPMDVLRFSPLGLRDRFRLGLLVLQVRRIKDWRVLEGLTARDWLIGLCGRRVFEIVWEPLLVGKFGSYADIVSAVWFWKKLALRGGSRTSGGRESLGYYRGSFQALAEAIAGEIRARGGEILTNAAVRSVEVRDRRACGVVTDAGTIAADAILATPALPVVARLIEPYVSTEYVKKLRAIEYLANVCLVLELDSQLSPVYWLNVNDAGFPFVGVIEHTNFESPETYGGRHVVYLSKYLPDTDPVFALSTAELLEYSLPHLRRMFPTFRDESILGAHSSRARYAQPVVQPHYSSLIPAGASELDGFFLATMAQIYPEDRGTNYAVREGRRAAAEIGRALRLS